MFWCSWQIPKSLLELRWKVSFALLLPCLFGPVPPLEPVGSLAHAENKYVEDFDDTHAAEAQEESKEASNGSHKGNYSNFLPPNKQFDVWITNVNVQKDQVRSCIGRHLNVFNVLAYVYLQHVALVLSITCSFKACPLVLTPLAIISLQVSEEVLATAGHSLG